MTLEIDADVLIILYISWSSFVSSGILLNKRNHTLRIHVGRHVHRHFGGQVLKPPIKGNNRQNEFSIDRCNLKLSN